MKKLKKVVLASLCSAFLFGGTATLAVSTAKVEKIENNVEALFNDYNFDEISGQAKEEGENISPSEFAQEYFSEEDKNLFYSLSHTKENWETIGYTAGAFSTTVGALALTTLGVKEILDRQDNKFSEIAGYIFSEYERLEYGDNGFGRHGRDENINAKSK